MTTSSPRYITPTLTSPSISIDPSAPGTIFRLAAASEVLANLIIAALLFLSPTSFLRLLSTTTDTSPIDPLAACLTQWIGALILTITIPLFLAVPNSKRGVESRPGVYLMYFTAEVVLVPVLIWQAVYGGEGVSGPAMVGFAGVLVGPMGLRGWMLVARPEWFGRFVEGRKVV